MSLLVLALVVVLGGGVAFGVALATRSKQEFTDANVIVPGVDTGAPAGWAGAHSTEARLHRRIRDAVRAVGANRPLDDPAMKGARGTLAADAVDIDRRLVAVSRLADAVRAEPLGRIEAAVAALEAASAALAEAPETDLTEQRVLGDTSAAISERMRALAEARAELDAEFPSTPTIEQATELIERGDDEEPGPTGTATA